MPLTNLQQISQLLRQELGQTGIEQRSFDEATASWLKQFLDQLNATERQLLPKKKQRALEEMGFLLKKYKGQAKQDKDEHRQEVIQQLIELIEPTEENQSTDWSALAEAWLDLIRPTWYEYLKNRHRSGPLLLKHMRSSLQATPLSTEALEEILHSRLWTKPLDQRIVAAILGIPSHA